MPLLALTVLGLLLLGVLGSPRPSPPEQPVAVTVPQTAPVAPASELPPSMFHGTVQAIDRHALHITIRTDIGGLIPVTIDTCDLLQGMQIGDQVRLAVNAQGTAYALETTGASLSTVPDAPVSSALRSGQCPEVAT